MYLRPRLSSLDFALPFLLLLSGFAGISYEILYGRLLGNLIGDQFAVSASVLITFLMGMGCGAAYAHRLRAWLWLIELGIGVFGILFALSYETLEALLYAHHGLFAASMAGKVIVCSLLLTTPAFLVGCSVPLFAWYYQQASIAAQFARVYAIYNFGAAITALALEFYLIRVIGIKGALWCFAAINLYVAIGLRLRFHSIAHDFSANKENATVYGAATLSALALASIASAIYQLFMLKWSEMIFGPFRETFALVLALVLLGIALGSWCVRRFRIGFAALMTANVIGLALLLAGTGLAVQGYATWYADVAEHHVGVIGLKSLVLLAVMAIPSVTFGATIPALMRDVGDAAKDSGRLLFISALANSGGFLLMVFVLHQYLDYGVQLLAMLGISLAAIVAYSRLRLRYLAYASIAMIGLTLTHRQLWDEDLLYLSYTSFHSPEEMRETRSTFKTTHPFKGYQDIFSVTWSNGVPHFFINGYVSFPLNSPSERIVGLLASMFSPRTDQALVLGLGSGSTASVVGLAFDRTDTVEINPAVRANLYQMKEWNFDIEHNPKVNIIVDDAIHFTRATEKKYSLILNTVTSPLYFSSSKLYTDDFFQNVASRLTPDGIYATWLDSRVGDKGFEIILNTLKQRFAECGIFYIKTTYFLLLCGQQPVALKQPDLKTRAPEVWSELLKKYYIQPDYLVYNLLSTRAFALLENGNAPINRLDLPTLEFEMAGLARKGIPMIKDRLAKLMNLADVGQAIAGVNAPWSAENWVVEAERGLENSYITRRWRELAAAANNNNYAQAHNIAELNYFASMAEDADTAKAHYKYGYQLHKRGREQEALAQYERALSLDNHYNNANFNMAASYERLGNLEKATDYFHRELVIDPADQDAVIRLGRIYIERGFFEKGLFYLDSVTDPPEEKTILYRAKAYEGTGNPEKATQLYAALADKPDIDAAIKQDAEKRLFELRKTATQRK